MKKSIFIISMILVMVIGMNGQQQDFPKLTGPYLGQKPPGKIPEIFAPGIVSTGDHEHSSPTFSPDGKSVYWSVVWIPFDQRKPHTIVFSTLGKDGWTRPGVASFSGQYGDDGPRFSPDGSRLFFYSKRPFQSSLPENRWHDIWYMEKKNHGWSEPMRLNPPINTEMIETSASLTVNGTLYFLRGINEPEVRYDLYRSRFDKGTYLKPELLDERINSPYHDYTPFVSPDERYFLFSSVNRPDGYGSGDLYVCFKKPDGTWTAPKNMGEQINTPFNERFPSVSPDGKYLFFVSNIRKEENAGNHDAPQNGYCDVYWVDANVIEELISKDLK